MCAISEFKAAGSNNPVVRNSLRRQAGRVQTSIVSSRQYPELPSVQLRNTRQTPRLSNSVDTVCLDSWLHLIGTVILANESLTLWNTTSAFQKYTGKTKVISCF